LIQSDLALLNWASQTQSMANCDRTARDSTMANGAYRKPTLLFRMVRSITPYDLPVLENRGSNSKCTSCDMSNFEWPYLRSTSCQHVEATVCRQNSTTLWQSVVVLCCVAVAWLP